MKLQTKSIATQIKESCGIVNYTINGEWSGARMRATQFTQIDKELQTEVRQFIVTGGWVQLRMGLFFRITNDMIISRNL